jgi:hypothetical protein
MKLVSHFGIHFDEDRIPWLLQQAGGANALGLKERSPFEVTMRRCNHQMDLAKGRWKAHLGLAHHFELAENELFKLMLPIPRREEGVYWVHADEKTLDELSVVSRMSSPVMSVVCPLWQFRNRREIFDELNITNIQPLLLYGIRSGDISLIRELLEVAKKTPRALIFASSLEIFLPHGVKKLKWQSPDFFRFAEAEWENIGAGYLYEWMQNANK